MDTELTPPEILIPILIFISAIFTCIFLLYRRKIKVLTATSIDFTHAGAAPISVPLLATFFSFRFLPAFIAIGYNNRNPKFVLAQQYLEYRVLFERQKYYSDIERVDVWIAPGAANLILHFKGSVVTLVANIYNQKNLKGVLQFLLKQQCPLTERAKEFLQSSET